MVTYFYFGKIYFFHKRYALFAEVSITTTLFVMAISIEFTKYPKSGPRRLYYH